MVTNSKTRLSADSFKKRLLSGLPDSHESLAVSSSPLFSNEVVVDLAPLFSIAGDAEFVEQAYQRILRRNSDISGFLHYREALRSGLPRELIVARLINSEEARTSGFKFQGAPGSLTSLDGHVRYLWRNGLRSIRFRLVARCRAWARGILQITRIERIERTVDAMLNQVLVRSDQILKKTDENLWTVSEKLDAYVADVVSRQKEQLARSNQTDAAMQAIQTQVAILKQQVSELEQEHQRSLDTLSTRIEAAGYRVVACEVDGFIIGVPSEEWRMEAYHRFRGPLEPGVVAIFKKIIKPGMVVADVGANIGLFTLEAARLTGFEGRVYSFEPTPRTFSILRDNLQVNGFLEAGFITARQIAISDRSGRARLQIYPRNSGHNTIFPEPGAGEGLEVVTVTLDEALDHEPRVDFVKIDAEGAEPLILAGMKQTIARNPRIAIVAELAPSHLIRAGVQPGAFLDAIQQMGFVYYLIDDLSGEPRLIHKEELLGIPSTNLLLLSSATAEAFLQSLHAPL